MQPAGMLWIHACGSVTHIAPIHHKAQDEAARVSARTPPPPHPPPCRSPPRPARLRCPQRPARPTLAAAGLSLALALADAAPPPLPAWAASGRTCRAALPARGGGGGEGLVRGPPPPEIPPRRPEARGVPAGGRPKASGEAASSPPPEADASPDAAAMSVPDATRVLTDFDSSQQSYMARGWDEGDGGGRLGSVVPAVPVPGAEGGGAGRGPCSGGPGPVREGGAGRGPPWPGTAGQEESRPEGSCWASAPATPPRRWQGSSPGWASWACPGASCTGWTWTGSQSPRRNWGRCTSSSPREVP